MTPGERDLITAVFGDSFDSDAVRLRHRCWWPLQPSNVVMAPDGDIWFHPDCPHWREDFSESTLGLRALFVHELVHVWQHQQGIRLPLRRWPLARYRYTLKPGKAFRRYGIEQQAMIVQHAYLSACADQTLESEPPLIARVIAACSGG